MARTGVPGKRSCAAGTAATRRIGPSRGPIPGRRENLAGWLREQKQSVRLITSPSELPVATNVKQADKVGLDRLLNALAVNQRKPAGTAAVVIDAGTAITVDYVDEAGVFQGGAILPGAGMMTRALHQQTATLPLIERQELAELHGAAALPGKSTVEAMALGVASCCQGGIEHLARAYLKLSDRVVTYIGGGDGPAVRCTWGEHYLWPEITLEGLAPCRRATLLTCWPV